MQQRLQRGDGVVQQRYGAYVLALVDHVVGGLVVHTVVPLVKVGVVIDFNEFVIERLLSKCIRGPLGYDAHDPAQRSENRLRVQQGAAYMVGGMYSRPPVISKIMTTTLRVALVTPVITAALPMMA